MKGKAVRESIEKLVMLYVDLENINGLLAVDSMRREGLRLPDVPHLAEGSGPGWFAAVGVLEAGTPLRITPDGDTAIELIQAAVTTLEEQYLVTAARNLDDSPTAPITLTALGHVQWEQVAETLALTLGTIEMLGGVGRA